MKKTKNKYIYIALVALILASLQLSVFVSAVYAVNPGEEVKYRDVDLLVPIPSFEDGSTQPRLSVPAASGGYFLNYVNLIVTWLMGILGMLCVGIFIVSGFQIMANFGNTEAVTQAKDRILSAVFGLILLITGTLLLHTLNPGFFRWDSTEENPSTEQIRIVLVGDQESYNCTGLPSESLLASALNNFKSKKAAETANYVDLKCFPDPPKLTRYLETDACYVYYSQVCNAYKSAQ